MNKELNINYFYRKNMNCLPSKLLAKSALLSLVVGALVLGNPLTPTEVEAASAYISPATGIINKKSSRVTVYVESSVTEPEISAAQIKITYPSSLTVVSITDGDFDSYLEKDNDTNTRTITVNAVNNAGNYKSGKVKLASINFEAIETTGQVQLQIQSTSSITGAGGESLLTETINGVYNLDIQDATTPTPSPSELAIGAISPTTTEQPNAVPQTGTSDVMVYLITSLGLIFFGVVSLRKHIAIDRR